MKKWILLSSAALIIGVAASIYTFGLHREFKPTMNIIVVSACSLRANSLGIYNPAKAPITPKLTEWAKNAFVFTNGAAERPWQNFTFEGREIVTRQLLNQTGYYNFWDYDGGYVFYVPPTEQDENAGQWYWGEKTILEYQESLEKLKEAVLKRRSRPFFLFAHLKYMHYPYLDTVNMGPDDFAELTPRSRELLARYRAHPDADDAKLPMVELLMNDFGLLKRKFGKQVYSVAGVVSDPQRDARWKQSPGYEDDLRLASELYDLKMKKFDSMAADVVNLFGDRELQKKTIVIFAGDHGEALMEHGVIGHSVNVYEEMIRYPLVVKFPGQTNGGKISAQITLRKLAELVKGVVEGDVTAKNLARAAAKDSPEYLLSRNCSDTIRSVRYQSHWKFIKNVGTDKNELYDLSADPEEKANVIDANPEMAWRLEEYLVDHLSDIRHDNRRGRSSTVCRPN